MDDFKDEKDLDNLLSVEKAMENGLDIMDYFDEESSVGDLCSSSWNETGETYQEDCDKNTVLIKISILAAEVKSSVIVLKEIS